VDFINLALRTIIGGICGLGASVHPMIGMTIISVLTGIGMLWVFGKTSNQGAIATTKKRLQAYLLEMRLFGDDISLVFGAQKKLILGNVRYIGLMMKPMIFLTAPLLLLLIHMDAFYGATPLAIGEPAVVTLQAAGRFGTNAPVPELEAPAGIRIETPGVRVIEIGQMSWRIRAEKPVEGDLKFRWGGKEWTKSVASGDPFRYLSIRRVTGLWDAFWYAGEPRLPQDEVDWIQIQYPPAELPLAGIELHWLIWFFAISMLAAYALKGYFGVTF
jgi:uncharacterized membrane protein (DUF106 family)